MTTEIDDNNPNDANIKVLREKAERADTLASEVDQLKRQLAVRDSKIDTSKPTYKLFEKAYDGEWTPEALDQAAKEYGLLKSETPAPGKQPAPTGQQQSPAADQQNQPPADGMEFSDEQLAWMRSNGMIPEEQFSGPSPAGDLFQQQAAAAYRMDAAQAGGQPQAPGQLSPTDWQNAKSPEEMMARYRAAGGVVASSE